MWAAALHDHHHHQRLLCLYDDQVITLVMQIIAVFPICMALIKSDG